MIFGYITLATALIISLSAAIYSILGLTAIFAAAFWPIVIMGGSLEVGKIITTLWLHKYWDKAEIQYKLYLCSAVAILMLLTSMGVFGFLSKAHSDQSLVSGDSGAKIAIYDEKIKISRDNIDANRRALTQMDSAVDQVMGRSTDEKGADKAVAIRRSQQAERGRLLKEIDAEQKKITALNEERAPLAAENRKIEAEVGPIKYIAALIYGDNADTNVLEKSVRWVIILIVIVFDPLALTLLLAATKSIEWEHGINVFNIEKKKRDEEEEEIKDETPFDDWTDEDYAALTKEIEEKEADRILKQGVTNSDTDGDVPIFEEKEVPPVEEDISAWDDFFKGNKSAQEIDAEIKQTPKLDPDPLPEKVASDPTTPGWMFGPPAESNAGEVAEPVVEEKAVATDIEPFGSEMQQYAMKVWKSSNPDSTYTEQFNLLDSGSIKHLPWENSEHLNSLNLSDRDIMNLNALKPEADNEPNAGEMQGFGITFPNNPKKGDMFLRVDNLPSQLYKFNGTQWIRVNKNLSDSYIYDDAYIDHLIEKIGSGEYDPDLLSDIERERIAEKLKESPDLG
jgi:hypothetical protein